MNLILNSTRSNTRAKKLKKIKIYTGKHFMYKILKNNIIEKKNQTMYR